jgi:hypothetical protein
MPSTYDVGDLVRATATFTSLTGALTDPTTVVCTVKHPDASVTTSSNTKSSTGVYYSDITIDADGWWYYRFAGTGTLVAAEEGSFFVRVRKVV